jgi:hypothetical protein
MLSHDEVPSDTCRRLISDCEALAAVCTLFDFSDHRDSENLPSKCHSDGERKLQSRSGPESFEKTRAGLCFGLERLGNPPVSVNDLPARPQGFRLRLKREAFLPPAVFAAAI